MPLVWLWIRGWMRIRCTLDFHRNRIGVGVTFIHIPRLPNNAPLKVETEKEDQRAIVSNIRVYSPLILLFVKNYFYSLVKYSA